MNEQHPQQLKREREQRGWSQERVAEELGTNKHTISRWERGISLPYPYYREKLVALFGKSVEELGLVASNIDDPRVTPSDASGQDTIAIQNSQQIPERVRTSSELEPIETKKAEASSNITMTQVKISSNEPMILDPFLPPATLEIQKLVGREEVLEQLRERLCRTRDRKTTTIYGLPGVGKTALATSLAYDAHIRTYFCDGILWAGMGPQARVVEHLNHWSSLLGLSPQTSKYVRHPQELVQLLRGLIGQRRFLFILDDVWQAEDALLLQIGGPNCHHLITTRFPLLGVQIAGPDETIALTELNEESGLALLALQVPNIVEREATAARTLVRRVGALPLALVLLGKYLQTQSYSSQPRRIQQALTSLNEAEKRLRIQIPFANLHGSSPHNSASSYSLYASIAISDQRLAREAQKALRDLSIIPPKPASFSEEAAAALLQEGLEVLDVLCDASLLESHGKGRYMLHQVIRDYAQLSSKNSQGEERLIEFGIGYLLEHERDYQNLEQESLVLFATLDAAQHLKRTSAFIQGVKAFLPYIQARGLYSMIEPYIQWALGMARAEGDEDATLLFLYHLGVAGVKKSAYETADTYFTQSLILAERRNSPIQINILLSQGYLQMSQGKFDATHVSFEKALQLAKKGSMLKEEQSLVPILTGLGMLALKRDQLNIAWDYAQQSRALLFKKNDPEQKSEVFRLIGTLSLIHGDYDEAQINFEQGLQEARQIQYRELISSLLRQLGLLAGRRGDYEQAKQYYQEALILAHQLENKSHICLQLMNLGLLALEQGDDRNANRQLQEAEGLARSLEFLDLLTATLINRAELARIQGDFLQAEQLYQEALSIVRKAGLTASFQSFIFGGLVILKMVQQDAQAAQGYLQEGMALAEEKKHPELWCNMLKAQGEYALWQKDIKQAGEAFEKLLEYIPEGDLPDLTIARYGLARTAALQKQWSRARQLGAMVIEQWRSMGQRRRQEAEDWLQSIILQEKQEQPTLFRNHSL